ncbi:hypothetical protein DM02DRAFT_725553 [Periconia macrospinosa]|uniref:Uncharacterized protein n=1 Tax=Periconia macrospinosa TaxID=97972 RepID=A0A2V1E3Z9_9PLEO|nr:hypothetical protein DM02DRAFT_725553 [Periconia macrospinosa]
MRRLHRREPSSPKRMSGHEVFVAVAAIVVAFHNAADLTGQIKRSQTQRPQEVGSQGELDAERRRLQISLQTAETQIAYHYAAMNQLGDVVRVGDGIARERLYYLAAVVQTDIVASLQLAVEYENAVLDLPTLHEAIITNRKNAIEALDEFKHRILFEKPELQMASPLQREISTSPRISKDSRGSLVSVLPAQIPPQGRRDSILVSIPAEGIQNAPNADLIQYFSAQRTRKERERLSSSSDGSNKTRASLPLPPASNDFHPALNFLLDSKTPEERSFIMEEIDELILAYQNLHFSYDKRSTLETLNRQSRAVKRDTLAMLMGLGEGDGDKNALDLAAMQLLRSSSWEESQENRDSRHYIPQRSNLDSNRQASYYASNRVPPTRRWSNSSSIYSDHTILSDPPSLYRDGSTSSRESDALPVELPAELPAGLPSSRQQSQNLRRKSFQHSGTPFWDMSHHLQTPTPQTRPNSRQQDPVEVARIVPITRARTPPIPAISSIPTTPTKALKPVGSKPLPPIPHYNEKLDQDYTTLPKLQDEGHLMPTIHHTSFQPSINLNHHPLTPTSSRPTTPSSFTTVSPRTITPHVVTTIISSAQEKALSGRPCKDNDYWGFCKGAWTIREDPKKGLGLETRPTGMYSTTQVWQCKQCSFEGTTAHTPHPTKRNKKETVFDQRIYKSSVGIRYRWLFLAKSHIRQASPASRGAEVTSYGCVICTAEKHLSGVFGGVETLMNHVFMEHARPGVVSDASLKLVRCILGRAAGVDEEWDLNIPNEENCVLLF